MCDALSSFELKRTLFSLLFLFRSCMYFMLYYLNMFFSIGSIFICIFFFAIMLHVFTIYVLSVIIGFYTFSIYVASETRGILIVLLSVQRLGNSYGRSSEMNMVKG